MSNVLKRVRRMNQRNKFMALLFIVLVAGGILYMGRISIVEFLSGNLSMQSGLSTSDTAVTAKLTGTLGGEDISISYAQAMFSQSIFKQTIFSPDGKVRLFDIEDFSYEYGSTGNIILVTAISELSTLSIKVEDIGTGTINTGITTTGGQESYLATLSYNIDGLNVGEYTYRISASVSYRNNVQETVIDTASFILTVTVDWKPGTEPDGIAIDSLNITLNWNTTIYRVQEDTFSLTYSIYCEVSPTGIDGANDYVLEKLISATVNDTDGSIMYELICGTDICKVENLYNSVWNIRIRIVIEGSVLDDLGQLMESTITLDPAKIVVIWDAAFAVKGGWE